MAKKEKKKIDVESIVPLPLNEKAQAPTYTGKISMEIVNGIPTKVYTNPPNKIPVPVAIQYCELAKMLLQKKLYELIL